jgi:CheY-like chemotaxis protein
MASNQMHHTSDHLAKHPARFRILIEDNEQNRYLATVLLETHGPEVTPAFDGAMGIELAGRLRP